VLAYIEGICSFELLGVRTFIHSVVLRKIFRPQWDEIAFGWRELHNEEFHNLYSSPDIIRMTKSRRMRLAGYVTHMGAKRNAYRILVGKPEGKRPLEGPGHSQEDNIKMDFREIVGGGIDWIHLAQDRDQWQTLVNMVVNIRVP
jgi:hypothetical protein